MTRSEPVSDRTESETTQLHGLNTASRLAEHTIKRRATATPDLCDEAATPVPAMKLLTTADFSAVLNWVFAGKGGLPLGLWQ